MVETVFARRCTSAIGTFGATSCSSNSASGDSEFPNVAWKLKPQETSFEMRFAWSPHLGSEPSRSSIPTFCQIGMMASCFPPSSGKPSATISCRVVSWVWRNKQIQIPDHHVEGHPPACFAADSGSWLSPPQIPSQHISSRTRHTMVAKGIQGTATSARRTRGGAGGGDAAGGTRNKTESMRVRKLAGRLTVSGLGVEGFGDQGFGSRFLGGGPTPAANNLLNIFWGRGGGK